MLKNNKIVYGGGATEVACSLYVADKADNTASIDQYAIRAFAEALEVIPISLADKSLCWSLGGDTYFIGGKFGI